MTAWTYKYDNHGNGHYDEWYDILDASGKPIARTYGANVIVAKLLTATPLLLDALMAYMDWWGEPPADQHSYDSRWEDCWKKGKAALEAAGGDDE